MIWRRWGVMFACERALWKPALGTFAAVHTKRGYIRTLKPDLEFCLRFGEREPDDLNGLPACTFLTVCALELVIVFFRTPMRIRIADLRYFRPIPFGIRCRWMLDRKEIARAWSVVTGRLLHHSPPQPKGAI